MMPWVPRFVRCLLTLGRSPQHSTSVEEGRPQLKPSVGFLFTSTTVKRAPSSTACWSYRATREVSCWGALSLRGELRGCSSLDGGAPIRSRNSRHVELGEPLSHVLGSLAEPWSRPKNLSPRSRAHTCSPIRCISREDLARSRVRALARIDSAIAPRSNSEAVRLPVPVALLRRRAGRGRYRRVSSHRELCRRKAWCSC
jgi:hypothetical protein